MCGLYIEKGGFLGSCGSDGISTCGIRLARERVRGKRSVQYFGSQEQTEDALKWSEIDAVAEVEHWFTFCEEALREVAMRFASSVTDCVLGCIVG